uniref:C2H2-type domain-containing protein n=1 Tax=Anopheles minimus TaxID=112268 RepID=A0A182WNS1_9DIPT
MCAAGPSFDWFADVNAADVCDMLPLITVNDNSVIAKEVTFEASEFLPPVFEEADFVLYNDHQLFTEINEVIHGTSSSGTILTHLNNEAQHQNVDSSPIGTVSLCTFCSLQFKCEAHLTRHQLLVHHPSKEAQNGKYVCDVCRKQCASSSHLHLHRKIHLAHKPYPCTFGCDRSFSSSGNRQKHIARMHTHEKKYHCTNCKESFIYARQLQLHSERKHAEFKGNSKGIIICTRCKESFDTVESFEKHRNKFDCLEHRPFECVRCAKRFKQATHLRNHLLTHRQDARAYGCEFCSKRFTLAGDLKVHRRIHTKEKPFRCHLCPAAFTMGKQLNKHRCKVHKTETEKKDGT